MDHLLGMVGIVSNPRPMCQFEYILVKEHLSNDKSSQYLDARPVLNSGYSNPFTMIPIRHNAIF